MEYTLNNKSERHAKCQLYPGLERMHCQKSLKGPGTVLNGFPSKQAYTTNKLLIGPQED